MGWRALPVVVLAIAIPDRGGSELFRGCLLEAADVHTHHLSRFRAVSEPERPHAAGLAEKMFVLHRIEQILLKLRFAFQQPECPGLHHGGPEAISRTDRAIATLGGLRQVDIRLESNQAAMA